MTVVRFVEHQLRVGHGRRMGDRPPPRTTASVKKLQKALGMAADGKVTPELLKQVTELKQLPPKPPRKRRAKKAAKRSALLAAVARALGEHEVVDGVCVTCEAEPSGPNPS